MPYDSLVSRADSSALVPEDVSTEMIGRVSRETSAALQLFRRVPVVGSQTRFPILSALPVAYWVTGDTGLKQTTEAAWDNKYLNIEELACIVPMPENVVDDLASHGMDVWSELRPDIEEAIGVALDTAIFFGTNAPSSFPDDVVTAATAAGNTSTEGATAANGGIADDIDELIGLIEADGFDPTGIAAARTLKGKLRRARDANGQKLVDSPYTMYEGMEIAYTMRGSWPTASGTVEAIVGDFSEFAIGIRKDITLKVLDQAVIQDNTGAIVYNLAQQDMVAARFTFRAGWQVSNRINRDQPTEANRYPAGLLLRA